MGHVWIFVTLTLVADGLAGLVGGLLSERWLLRHQAALVGFAAGALLAAVFLDVLPESLESFGRGALAWAFASFVAFAFLEWLLGYHHHKDEHEHSKALPGMLLTADALHNVGDGASVAAAFLISPRAGLAVALAVVAHEVPQEVGDYAILRDAGFSRPRALLALGGVQVTAFLGALAVLLAASRVERLTGAMLSIAAGSFLYIGATDLLPEIHSGRTSADRRERMLGFVCGVALLGIALSLVG